MGAAPCYYPSLVQAAAFPSLPVRSQQTHVSEFLTTGLQQMGRSEELINPRTIHSDDIPVTQRDLLDHQGHMTLLQQSRHDGIELDVLNISECDGEYLREILFRRRPDLHPVQYAILQAHTALLPEAVRLRLVDAKEPLGRILVEAGVSRRIEVTCLLSIETTATFRERTDTTAERLYGRQIVIHCDDKPAVEAAEFLLPES